MSQAEPHKPHVSPSTNLAEITLKSVLLGAVLAVVLGAANMYLGLFAGISAMAVYASDGYDDNAFLYQIFSMKGALWGGTGILLGCALAAVGSAMKPALLESRTAGNMVPWLDGGLLMDVETNEVLVRGLSMPHSPRLYAGRLWFLE